MRSGGSLQGPCARIDDRGVLETRRAGARLQWLVLKNAATCGSSDSVPSVGVHVSSCKGGDTSSGRLGRKAFNGSRMRTSLAARATGNGVARESVSWLRLVHTCEVQRARRVCPRFVSCCRSRSTRAECPKKLSACPQKQAGGERGLAQSGRPRRAKRHRGSDHGGKTVSSTPVSEGIRKGVAVAGLRSMEGASGRRSRSLFTRGRGKRSRPISPSVIAKSMTCEGWVTGASEVGCSRATTAGENTPCREREQVASA